MEGFAEYILKQHVAWQRKLLLPVQYTVLVQNFQVHTVYLMDVTNLPFCDFILKNHWILSTIT